MSVSRPPISAFLGALPDAHNGGYLHDGTYATEATDRGFTDHEHLDRHRLIHMNGRAYDPRLGRFLSVDPLIQVPDNQGLNAYSYVRNNPLVATDPSGYELDPVGLLIGMVAEFLFDMAADKVADWAAEKIADKITPDSIHPFARNGVKNGIKGAVKGVLKSAIKTGAKSLANSGTSGGAKPKDSASAAASDAAQSSSGASNASVDAKANASPSDIGGAESSSALKEVEIDASRSPRVRGPSGKGGSDRPPAEDQPRWRHCKTPKGHVAARNEEGFDRDETPPAVLRQDGDPVLVDHIPRSDNRSAGGQLGAQIRGHDGEVVIRIKRE